MKRSKKYAAVLKKIDKTKKYTPEEAIKVLPQISLSKFPGSVDLEIKLNLNEKQKKESIRGSYALPHTFGKVIRVLVFADKSEEKNGKEADIIGGEELIPEVEAGKLEYDVVISTPAMMPKIAKLGKILGTKGLMPNPKNGTITTDLGGTIAKFKAGTKYFKMQESGRINAVIGKVDMEEAKLVDNFQTFIKSVLSEVKKFGSNPIKSIILSPTMGPKLSIDLTKITEG